MTARLLLLTFLFSFLSVSAQEPDSLQWWNPESATFPVIEGQAWPKGLAAPYGRLPARAKPEVREVVWNLSEHAAGLMIRFRSNAEEIVVRYGTKADKAYGMDHMPATGVSGLDLYAIDSDGQEWWCAGKRSFGDTIQYRFAGLQSNDGYHQQGREYRLYLPLYNQVNWLEIGVGKEVLFEPLPVRKEKPIVVYGTSIAQGACASRPGMAWTAILGRKLDRPLINLGFSGNGMLEAGILDLMVELDPKVYVLDCMPNLIQKTISDEELTKRVLTAVRQLAREKPGVPILLVDHAGYSEGGLTPLRKEAYERVNRLQQVAFYQLKREGIKQLYYLPLEEIGLSLDATVDGTHPTDLGMMQYAEGYERKLRDILQEPVGDISPTQPITQYREPGNYDWEQRHRDILSLNANDPPKTIFFANSIIHFWGGLPRAKVVREEESWETVFTPMGVLNYAYGWDRIENVLWRVYHDELDGFEAEKILLMIGTNNLHLNSDEEILAGLDLLVQAIQVRQPSSEMVLMGILPRRDYEGRVADLNLNIARLAGKHQVAYADLGPVFLQENQRIDESLFSDGLHPNAAGYVKMRGALKEVLIR